MLRIADESNINRFIKVLQRFLAHSQFIIITHNKRTIGMADVLYGVTMEEHGISKIVSVKFHKADEDVTDHRAKPLVPPAANDAEVENAEDTPHKSDENGGHRDGEVSHATVALPPLRVTCPCRNWR